MLIDTNKKRKDLPTMNEFLDEFFGNKNLNGLYNPIIKSNKKNINILEKENSYEVSIELPGFSKNDIKIEVIDDILKISSIVEKSENNDDENYIVRNFIKSSFEKSFILNEDSDKESIDAKMENGILNIVINKIRFIEEKPQVKLIEIK